MAKIRYEDEAIREILDVFISESAKIAMFHLLCWSSNHMVDGHYSSHEADPEGYIDLDAEYIHRIVKLSRRRWNKVRSEIARFFEKDDRGYRLKERKRWIMVRGVSSSLKAVRPSISPVMRMFIGMRDNWTCGYCGTQHGPFDIDHIIPISRGGALSDTENLICACAKCNRSKSDKLVAEWIS